MLNIGSFDFILFSGTDSPPDGNVSDLQKITLGNCKATCITVTSICRIGKALEIGNVNDFFFLMIVYLEFIQHKNLK